MKYQIPEKRCENCKRYKPHYARIGKEGKRIRYGKTFCGHCRVNERFRHRDSHKKACEYWEEIE